MPVNRNALIRYRTIDHCLQNRHRRWTLEDLMDACSEALYEYEGIDKGVSKRSIQMDLQLMRSDKLGYNAPIIVLEKKYYTYEDPDYSITNIPLTEQDLGKLTEVAEILRQFKGFNHFQELNGMVQRLENKIYSVKTKQEPVIDFEKNDNLKGLEHLETLYQAIIEKKAIDLTYQSFKARSAGQFIFHPYYLKEYRNRWFILGVKKRNTPIINLALDRIISIQETTTRYVLPSDFNATDYFKHVIGVSVNQNEPPVKVVLFADNATAPYIQTKPLHHSQQIVEKLPEGIIFAIEVQLNFELEREILGFGDRIKIIAPEKFKRRIRDQFENAWNQYENEFSFNNLNNTIQKVHHKGSGIVNHVFGKKAVNNIKAAISNYQQENPQEDLHAIRDLFGKIPALKDLIFTTNLLVLIGKINRNLFLTKAIFFDKTPDANWYVTWHQDTTINVTNKIELEGFTGWTKKSNMYGVCPPEEILKKSYTLRIHLDDTNEQNGALKIVLGTHNKKLTDSEIQLISQHSISQTCAVAAGGVHVMKPLILHSSAKAISQKHRRVIHLEFNSVELPAGLAWAEKVLI